MSDTLPGSIEIDEDPDSFDAVLGDLIALEELVTRFTEGIVHRLRFHLQCDATGKRLRYAVSLFTGDLRRKFIDHLRSHAVESQLAAYQVQAALESIAVLSPGEPVGAVEPRELSPDSAWYVIDTNTGHVKSVSE